MWKALLLVFVSVIKSGKIKAWKLKKLLRYLKNSRGNGTSMISLIIPPTDQLHRASKLLTDEYGTASNIKSRVNRLSVLSAITSAQHKLKTLLKIPPNGVGIFTGTVLENNKERKISMAVEPLRPINYSLYLCDSVFHVDGLLALFDNDSKYGFIIMDGHSTLFATLQGSVKEVLHSMSVDLPKKHGRGGQSSVRFARLRAEKRNLYVRKVAETAGNIFPVEIEGFIFGGSADFKRELKLSEHLNPRIKNKVLKLVDTNYGGLNGLTQSIEQSVEVLRDVQYAKEVKVLQKFFTEVSSDGKYTFGFQATRDLLDSGAISELIIYEGLKEMEGEEEFIDWIAEHYEEYGVELVVVSNRSAEGSQFVDGFGGIGGLLKYKVEIEEYMELEEVDDADIF